MTEKQPSTVARDVVLWGLLMAGVLVLSLIAVGPLFNLLPKNQPTPSVTIFETQLGNCPSEDTSACGFSPSSISIPIGRALLFTHSGSLSHTVTSSNTTASGFLFDSGTMTAGGAYAFELSATPGRYDYFCQFHSWMNGTVTVG